MKTILGLAVALAASTSAFAAEPAGADKPACHCMKAADGKTVCHEMNTADKKPADKKPDTTASDPHAGHKMPSMPQH